MCRFRLNRRQTALIQLAAAAIVLIFIGIGGQLSSQAARVTDFSRKNMPPCPAYPFGTDWLGRDMFARTLAGLSISIRLGVLAAAVSGAIALLLGTVSAVWGGWADAVITFFIDLTMGVPHILLLILISVAMGKGFRGVAVGIALTHWPSLARLIRAEVIQLRESPYILIAQKLGKTKRYLAGVHFLPHLLPQFLVGLVLQFPHAILHESSVTFLGFGLSSEQPAIGIILSESMKYLITGKWWLACLPGGLLVLTAVLFYLAGETIRKLISPGSAHE